METPTSSRRNRRSSMRRQPKRNTKATCTTGKFGMGKTIAVVVLDISETGVRLRVPIEFAPGQEIELQLSSVCCPKPIRMTGEVVRCLQTADEEYCIGVRFRQPLPYRDLQSL